MSVFSFDPFPLLVFIDQNFVHSAAPFYDTSLTINCEKKCQLTPAIHQSSELIGVLA